MTVFIAKRHHQAAMSQVNLTGYTTRIALLAALIITLSHPGVFWKGETTCGGVRLPTDFFH